jgi:hypothetical protein
MSNLFSVEFVKDAGLRAIYTFAQTAVSILGGTAVGLVDIDFAGVANISAGAAFVSILTSVVRWSKPADTE